MVERWPGGAGFSDGPGGRDVLAYYAYKATAAVELYRPVMYLYFLSAGLDFTQIALLEAVYNVTTVAGEVPTGYVGDRIGRRNSLLVGTVLIAATLAGIGLADSFLALAGLYVCWSLGYTFRSGSEDAWLYDVLAEARSADAFAHVRGRGESVSLVTGVAGGVVGGYLGGVDLAYPFFVASGVTALGVVGLLAMRESAAYREGGSAAESGTGAGTDGVDGVEASAEAAARGGTPGLRRTLRIVRESVSDRDIRSFVLYYFVLFAAVTYLAFIFLQPVFEAVAVDAGLAPADVEPALGWFYAAYSLLGAALAYSAGAIRGRVGLRRWFYALPFVVGGALAGSYVLPLLALPALLVTRGVADVTKALAGQYVNDRIESVGRATVLSAMAMVSALAVVPFQLAAGALADETSALAALAAGGVVLVVGSAALLLLTQPVRTADGRRG